MCDQVFQVEHEPYCVLLGMLHGKQGEYTLVGSGFCGLLDLRLMESDNVLGPNDMELQVPQFGHIGIPQTVVAVTTWPSLCD